MNNIPYEKIMEHLHQMGMVVTDNIKSGVEIAYPIVLRQVYVDMVRNLLWFILGVIVLILARKLWLYINEMIKKTSRRRGMVLVRLHNFFFYVF